MTAPRYAGLAAKFLRESVNVDGPPPSANARDAAILAIEQAIAARSRRQKMRVWGMSAGGMAAAAALVLGIVKLLPVLHAGEGTAALQAHPVGPTSAVYGNGQDVAPITPLLDGALVSRGQRVSTPKDTKVVFAHATGTELTLNGGSEMSVVDDGQSRVYALNKGKLDLRVAKLKTNERLVVQTKDAEVEVRGTRFHVEVMDPAASCDGRSTRVSVDEGVVVVRRDGTEARLTAGQSWPACTQQSTAITPVQQPNAAQVGATGQAAAADPTPAQGLDPSSPNSVPNAGTGGAAGDGRTANTGSNMGGSPAQPTQGSQNTQSTVRSTLEEQNDLFAEGIDKKHRGDMAGAASTFERLLTKFPQSPLAENASAERLKALRASNPAAANRAARDYLNRWPHGFAREEAESVLREAP
jgi:ferric-dicitrate binding protein FerR (iron transport regulator)